MQKMSCNGCRVLRKGCSDQCSLRPCLEWITNPHSQGYATIFLAKFYGRTGLINLINAAGPQHLRPAIFRSLLYEACGRVVDPIQGSAGLLCSGSWQLCQNAVDAVLCGAPITQMVATTDNNNNNNNNNNNYCYYYNGPPDFGIMHHVNLGVLAAAAASDYNPNYDLLFRARSFRFKRSAKIRRGPATKSSHHLQSDEEVLVDDEKEVGLDLMLGIEPFKGCVDDSVKKPKKLAPLAVNGEDDDSGLCRMELGLHYPALSFV